LDGNSSATSQSGEIFKMKKGRREHETKCANRPHQKTSAHGPTGKKGYQGYIERKSSTTTFTSCSEGSKVFFGGGEGRIRGLAVTYTHAASSLNCWQQGGHAEGVSWRCCVFWVVVFIVVITPLCCYPLLSSSGTMCACLLASSSLSSLNEELLYSSLWSLEADWGGWLAEVE
jgi:hypothetical protein